MYPSKTRDVPNIEIDIYWYVLGTYLYIPFYDPEVCTRYILFSSSTYSKSNILDRFEPGTYLYILDKKSMYLVHTLGKKYVPGTYRFMSVYIGTIL
jgi:hypothetical protein